MGITVDGQTQYEGRVLATFQRNLYDDSDFFALVVTDRGEVDAIMTGTTRWQMSDPVKVDATPDMRKVAEINMAHRLLPMVQRGFDMPDVGKHVRSLTTKGKAKGITGTVVATKIDQYQDPHQKRYNPRYVAKVKVDGPEENPHYGRYVYVAMDRLEATEMMTEQEALELAYAHVARHGFSSTWTELHSSRFR